MMNVCTDDFKRNQSNRFEAFWSRYGSEFVTGNYPVLDAECLYEEAKRVWNEAYLAGAIDALTGKREA